MPKIAEIEPTPNPNAVKFILKEPLTRGVARSFDSADKAEGDSLARELFAIPHVTNVYYIDRWLTVTQDGGADWSSLMRQIADPIRAAKAEDPSRPPAGNERTWKADTAELQVRLEAIEAVLDERIRPALQADGGDILVAGLEENVLKIRYQGACGTCPSSQAGTLMAIENMLREIEPHLMVMAV
jgi:Fe-S cluster biogenesis protein NfuA